MGRKADAVEEGMTIADAAARLAVRNHIVVETIARGGVYDPDSVAVVAREILDALSAEQEAAAELAARLRRRAGGLLSDSDGTHDYRDRDRRNLRLRRDTYAGVARRLRALAASPEAVAALVERARSDAWGDVASNLDRRLRVEAMRPDADPDYASMREARLDAFTRIDLQRLRARTRRRAASRPK